MAVRVESSRRLSSKLWLFLLALTAALAAVLLGYLGPLTERGFLAGSDTLIERSAGEVRQMVTAHAERSRTLLVDLVRHGAEARRRTAEDLPLSLYGGDVERIRRALQVQDEARARRLEQNVGVLVREMARRDRERVAGHVERLRVEQAALSRRFVSAQRAGYWTVAGGLVLALVAVLGIGLDRLVTRPLRELRRATRAVAAGQLDVEIGADSGDEVGELARDFGGMLRQLRASRTEIERKNAELAEWNRTLELQVERKTRHLERAMEDLRRAQRQLAQAERLASLGTLAGGVAHEFNNLIGGIRGCVGEALEDERDARRREPLEVVQRAADRAAEVTDKLLEFARPKVPRVAPWSLAGLAGEVLDLVEPQARRVGVQLERRLSEDAVVAVDAGGLHQVLLNLVTNALQAMPSGGRLSVETEVRADEVRIAVADSGPGIAAEELPHVFDPFYSSRSGHAEVWRRGTGLGLSLSYGIVEAHGGQLLVDSQPGVGSTFTIVLQRRGEGASGDG